MQGIDDARAERDYLVLVLADAEANAVIFERMIQDWEAARDAAAALRDALHEDARPSDSGLLFAVARAGTVNTIPPRDASFRDMEATGSIRLISDPELRAQIVSYFTQDLHLGRPSLEDRTDLRFRTFYRERIASDLTLHREMCPSEIAPFECRLNDPRAADDIWAELKGEALRGILNVTHAGNGAALAHAWLNSTNQLLARLRERLGR